MHASLQHSTSSVASRRGAASPPWIVHRPLSRDFVIEGVTHGGKPFRPGDWSERLAGALSSFRPRGAHIGAHIGYSPDCVPRVVANVKCVIVNEGLRNLEPMAWEFVMNFARDNELRWHERAPVDVVGD
jgi:hypothetical protein